MSKTMKMNIVIILTSYSVSLQFTVSPILEKIQTTYPSASVSAVQMLMTVPMLLGAVMALVSGWLVHHISKKRLMLIGSLICFATGMVPMFLGGFLTLFISRAILGIGLGGLTALSASVIADVFEGKARIAAMGLQASAIGGSILLISTISGFLGNMNYRYSMLVHLPALAGMLAIFFLLEDRGKVVDHGGMAFDINKKVYKIVALSAVEFLFLVTFSTNIAMHMSGDLAGNASIAGIITGVFAAAQMLAGVSLQKISKYTKANTLAAAMGSFSISGILLIFFSDNLWVLLSAALFAGLSQGIFVPRAMFEASEIVRPEATAMAAALVSAGLSAGQFLSPMIMNGLSDMVFGQVQTTYVYGIGAVMMAVVSLGLFFRQRLHPQLV